MSNDFSPYLTYSKFHFTLNQYTFSPASLAAIEFNGEVKPKSGKLKFLLASEN